MANITKIVLTISTAIAVLGMLTGCGGHKTIPEAGSMRINIKWPAQVAATRLIPTASNSIVVNIDQGGQTVFSTVIARPSNTVVLPNLPLGNSTITATAYPNANGTGTAQAAASQAVEIVAGPNNNFSVTMQSTIDHFDMTAPSSMNALATTTVIATPKNASGDTVLVTPGNIVFTSSAPLVAAINPSTGFLTALLLGNATITATDLESGKNSSTSLSVALSMSVTPATASVSVLGTKLFTATVVGSPNTLVTWSVDGVGHGSINALGLYSAPATPGTYTIRATSVINPSQSTTATVTVQSGSGSIIVN